MTPAFEDTAWRLLLGLARRSTEYGLEHERPLPVELCDYPPSLRERRAVFVTLRRSGALRGCMGELDAHLPLVETVAQSAFNAAFRDPRFPPLRFAELGGLEIDVSVLSSMERLEFDSEADLVAELRPGVDGLVLQDGTRRETFLPSVWESLPDPRAFLRALKRKALLPEDHWSDRIEALRYTTTSAHPAVRRD